MKLKGGLLQIWGIKFMKNMTINDAILKSLEDLKEPQSYSDIYKHIKDNGYYTFTKGKTPDATISALLGNFIRDGDIRVRRIKTSKGFLYYLTQFEGEISSLAESKKLPDTEKKKTYNERALHTILSSYLKHAGILSKTIFHEKSKNTVDKHQKWVHPDMIGVKFTKLETSAATSLFRTVNIGDAFQLYSYEIKKTIYTDYELKEAYFQAVSNSSWANYGYLVAFEISSNLYVEMERLNQSFGIGVIELKANPFESKVLFAAKLQKLDYITIDKLSKVNKDFQTFIEEVEKLLTAEEKYVSATRTSFNNFCDDYLTENVEILKYCKEKFIPVEDENSFG